MKILFEDYSYQTEDIKSVLGDFILSKLDLTKQTQLLRYVGYFFNSEIENEDGTKGDLVFILPKVLIDVDKDGNETVFGLNPRDIIHFNYEDWKKDESIVATGTLTKKKVYDFIYGFAIWIYRAVDIYRKNQNRKPKDEQDAPEAEVMTSVQVGQSGKKEDVTHLDVLLSLLDFQRTHQNFITFVMKIAHSGYHKISWTKTISKTQPLLQDGTPIYMNPINKKRVVNFDEELLVIYYSILNYMHEEYGFPITNQPGYELLKGAKFKSYLEKGQGKRRLHQIRYKYFSDDALLLWNLCYAFFDKSDNVKGQAKRKDYLLVSKFETVFEAMIDELIGDKNLPKELKNQADDKRIDHIYSYKYLLENEKNIIRTDKSQDIYNIADSKYYKKTSGYQHHDVPKQFTYARNVIQWHMDFLHDLLYSNPRYQEQAKEYVGAMQLYDSETEGFNIMPNFFVSSFVNEELSYEEDGFSRSQMGNVGKEASGKIPWRLRQNVHESYIFRERLFDRNTYFTLHYNVNFLYVLKQYAQNRSATKANWKHEVQEKFRTGMLEFLNQEFDFYQVAITENEIPDFVEKHYRKIIGKVFSFKDANGNTVLLYAERKNPLEDKHSDEYNADSGTHILADKLIIPAKDSAIIYNVKKLNNLGEDAYLECETTAKSLLYKFNYDEDNEPQYYVAAEPEPLYNSSLDLSTCLDTVFLIGCYKNDKHLNWINKNQKYNVRLGERRGAVKENDEQVVTARFLILYDFEKPSEYKVYPLESRQWVYKLEDMKQLDYPTPNGAKYLLYGLKNEVSKIDIDVQEILKEKNVQQGSPLEGAPIYLTGKELQEYVETTK